MPKKNIFGLSSDDRGKVIKGALKRRAKSAISIDTDGLLNAIDRRHIPSKFTKFEKLPDYKEMEMFAAIAGELNIQSPFFKLHEGISGATAQIGGRDFVNYANYNYLGLNGDPRVSQAAKDAIDQYGTSVSASRVVSGERQIHRDLETALSEMIGTEDCVTMVSGHAANVTTIGYLMGSKDLIIHDSLAHNSIIQGAMLSGATRWRFEHGDCDALDKTLTAERHKFERVLIIVEGVYSMDGDTADVARLVEIKNQHKCWLMVDEAHSLGILGASGIGVREHFDIKADDVEIWMGTMSKTLASCGGFIAGSKPLIEMLKFRAPGFLYSVGMPPPVAAAALTAIQIMLDEPERVKKVQDIGQFFLSEANAAGFHTGPCQGHALVPIIIKDSALTVRLSNLLFEKGINVQPIIYPVVEEASARLRFFVSAEHTQEQIKQTLKTTAQCLDQLKNTKG